jgi:hypothetical protein
VHRHDHAHVRDDGRVRVHVCVRPPHPDECDHNQQCRVTCSCALVVRESEYRRHRR